MRSWCFLGLLILSSRMSVAQDTEDSSIVLQSNHEVLNNAVLIWLADHRVLSMSRYQDHNLSWKEDQKETMLHLLDDSESYQQFLLDLNLRHENDRQVNVDFDQESILIEYWCNQCLTSCLYPHCHRNACLYKVRAWKLKKQP